MRTNLAGEEVRRTYSLCSSPLDKKWRVAIKKVEGGLFSSFANENLKEGDVLDVMEPVGKFYTELDTANKKKLSRICSRQWHYSRYINYKNNLKNRTAK